MSMTVRIKSSFVLLQQTKKESRRRASKEVPAPSKAVQSVSGSGDTVPLSQAGDER